MTVAPAGRSVHVLLVEDNPGDALFVRKGLERLKTPTDLHVAVDAQKALSFLGYEDGTPANPPDLILLDLNLPGMKGLEFLELLRGHERLRDLCVVVLTSSSADRDIERARQLRANGYLLKPSSLDQLFRLLVQVEEYWMSGSARAGAPQPPRWTWPE